MRGTCLVYSSCWMNIYIDGELAVDGSLPESLTEVSPVSSSDHCIYTDSTANADVDCMMLICFRHYGILPLPTNSLIHPYAYLALIDTVSVDESILRNAASRSHIPSRTEVGTGVICYCKRTKPGKLDRSNAKC